MYGRMNYWSNPCDIFTVRFIPNFSALFVGFNRWQSESLTACTNPSKYTLYFEEICFILCH